MLLGRNKRQGEYWRAKVCYSCQQWMYLALYVPRSVCRCVCLSVCMCVCSCACICFFTYLLYLPFEIVSPNEFKCADDDSVRRAKRAKRICSAHTLPNMAALRLLLSGRGWVCVCVCVCRLIAPLSHINLIPLYYSKLHFVSFHFVSFSLFCFDFFCWFRFRFWFRFTVTALLFTKLRRHNFVDVLPKFLASFFSLFWLL